MEPVVAPLGTVPCSWVSESTVKEVAEVPLKDTALVPVKPLPVRVTWVPTGPLVGEKEVMVGGPRTEKGVAEELVPSRLETEIGPLEALPSTTARSRVSEITVKIPAVLKSPKILLKETFVVPVKYLPVMVTSVPTGPLVGVKLVMMGGVVTVKLVVEEVVPAGFVTLMGPDVALLGTVARSWVSELTVKEVAGVPLKVTALVPVKLLPVRVTWVPTGPLEGVKETMIGGLRTVKLVAEEPEPSGVVTEIGPVVAPLGTDARS